MTLNEKVMYLSHVMRPIVRTVRMNNFEIRFVSVSENVVQLFTLYKSVIVSAVRVFSLHYDESIQSLLQCLFT